MQWSKRCRFDPWVRKIPWSRKWQPTPVFLPGKSHGQRSLEATVRGVSRVGPWLRVKAHLSSVALLGGSRTHQASAIGGHSCVPAVFYAKSRRLVTRSLSHCLAAGTVTPRGPREHVPSWRPRAHPSWAMAAPSSNKTAAIRTLLPSAG